MRVEDDRYWQQPEQSSEATHILPSSIHTKVPNYAQQNMRPFFFFFSLSFNFNNYNTCIIGNGHHRQVKGTTGCVAVEDTD